MIEWFEAIGERLRTAFEPRMRATRKWCRRGLVGLGCCLLAACAEQAASVTPAETLALLRTGQPLLSCREPCLAEWQSAQPQAAQLVKSARWQDLAMLLLRIRYEDDLSLYYLGRAADGIGYRRAAVRYYRQSIELSRTPASCRHLSRVCGGVALPRAASLRVVSIEREFNRRRARPTESAPPDTATPAEAASEGEAPAPAPVPLPLSGPATPPASDYIEPPPVVR
jgi:hypothetical protein